VKAQALREKEELKTQSHSLEIAIEKVCKSVPLLNIPEDVTTTTKVRKLVVAVRASMDEIGKVTFDF